MVRSHSVLYIPNLMLLSIFVSLLQVIETFQHIIREVLLVFPIPLNNWSGFFACVSVDAYQAEFVLNAYILTFLAYLGTLGAMDPFDDPNDVLVLF
jgi:hypothetical protein